MNKKILILIIGTLLGTWGYFLAIFTGAIDAPSFIKGNDNELSDTEKIKKTIETTRPTDIVILGNDISFELDIDHRIIKDLNKDELDKVNKEYKVIIINDLEGKLSIDNEDIEKLNERISENGTMVIYLGEQYSEVLNQENEGISDINGNLCFAYYSWGGNPVKNIGYWNQSDQEMIDKYPYSLGQSLLYCIDEYLQSEWK